jgi:hypothetical protein
MFSISGTRDTGSYATFSDVVDYLAWLGRHYTDDKNRRACLEAAGRAIHDHEQSLAEAMMRGTGNLRGLADIPGLHVIGGTDNARREGVVSLWIEGRPSEEIVAFLNARGVRTQAPQAIPEEREGLARERGEEPVAEAQRRDRGARGAAEHLVARKAQPEPGTDHRRDPLDAVAGLIRSQPEGARHLRPRRQGRPRGSTERRAEGGVELIEG